MDPNQWSNWLRQFNNNFNNGGNNAFMAIIILYLMYILAKLVDKI